MIGVIAVAAVTYMIVWMRRHARGIKAALEGEAATALAAGSTMALVAMAFLAVLREGFETSVFLLAAFQDASDTHRRRRRRGARPAGRGGDRPRPLSRRRPHQPDQVLPDHRPGPRLRRRRAARIRRPHRPRGGLDQQPPGPGGRPHLAGPAGHDHRLAADRDARPAAEPDRDRGVRLPRLRGADAALRGLARPTAPAPARSAPAAASATAETAA